MSLVSENFEIIPAERDEIIPEGVLPKDAVELLARAKAEEIFETHKDELIISADTVVSIDGKILGKPWDKAEASEMLHTLSGRTHSVYTGVCVIFEDGTETSFCEETLVEFYSLSDKEIADYISSGEPMDKAGAYGIQGRGALFVKRIEGDYYNVMGLPVSRLYHLLKERNAD